MRNTLKTAVALFGIALNVVVLGGLLFLAAAGFAGCLPSKAPRPPRGNYSLEQAQRYVQRMNSVEVRNQGYRQVKP